MKSSIHEEERGIFQKVDYIHPRGCHSFIPYRIHNRTYIKLEASGNVLKLRFFKRESGSGVLKA